MKQTFFSLIATMASATLLLAASPSASATATHDYFPESYDEAHHFAAGEGLCVPWAGTEHQVREGGYRLVTPSGGHREGELHVNGAINGFVTLTPDDPSLPTYVGTYREKVNGVFVGVDSEGEDVARVSQYRAMLPLVGTDGSRLTLTLSGKLTVNGNGITAVTREVASCRSPEAG